MSTTKDFFQVAKQYLEKAKETQREPIKNAAVMMANCMETDGIIQLFGIDQGRAFSMELGYRAGGLMPFHQFNTKDLALRGVISEKELYAEGFNDNTEMAHKLWDLYRVEPTDMFIIISNSGCEGIVVEAALMAKEKGHKVIAVVSKANCAEVSAKHPSGKKLVDVADIVIDNCSLSHDALLDFDGTNKITQASTITGNVIAQMLTAEVYHYLKSAGKDCPVLLSANIKGADIHNRELSDKYLGRWNS